MAKNIHVMPINDVIEHQCSADCPCGPMRDIEEARLIVHTAFDGREVESEVAAQLVPLVVN